MNATIIVLTYNHEKFITDFLNSVKYQAINYNGDKKHHLQLILSDDCSKDNTVEVAERWKEKNGDCIDDFLIIKNEKNLGTCRNWINGLDRATGDYVKAIGGDDLLPETSIFSLFKYLDSYDMVFGVPFIYHENADNEVDEILRILHKTYCIQKEENKLSYYDLIHRYCFINAPGTYISKRLLTDKRVTEFLTTYKYTDDYPQWLKMSEICEVRFTYVPIISVIYRRTDVSTYIVRNDELLNEQIRVHEYALETSKTLKQKALLKNELRILNQIKSGKRPETEWRQFVNELYWIKGKSEPNPFTRLLIERTIEYITKMKDKS